MKNTELYDGDLIIHSPITGVIETEFDGDGNLHIWWENPPSGAGEPEMPEAVADVKVWGGSPEPKNWRIEGRRGAIQGLSVGDHALYPESTVRRLMEELREKDLREQALEACIDEYDDRGDRLKRDNDRLHRERDEARARARADNEQAAANDAVKRYNLAVEENDRLRREIARRKRLEDRVEKLEQVMSLWGRPVGAVEVLDTTDDPTPSSGEGEPEIRPKDPWTCSSEEERPMAVAQRDLAAILRALGLGDHARVVSPHDVVHQEVLPEIRRLVEERDEAREREEQVREDEAKALEGLSEAREELDRLRQEVERLRSGGRIELTAGAVEVAAQWLNKPDSRLAWEDLTKEGKEHYERQAELLLDDAVPHLRIQPPEDGERPTGAEGICALCYHPEGSGPCKRPDCPEREPSEDAPGSEGEDDDLTAAYMAGLERGRDLGPRQPTEPPEGGVARIAAERRRQVEREGWSPKHDDTHDRGGLASAAMAYAWSAREQILGRTPSGTVAPPGWPWDEGWWKPKDPIRDLERAGALIAAELDRLLRARGVSIDYEPPTEAPEGEAVVDLSEAPRCQCGHDIHSHGGTDLGKPDEKCRLCDCQQWRPQPTEVPEGEDPWGPEDHFELGQWLTANLGIEPTIGNVGVARKVRDRLRSRIERHYRPRRVSEVEAEGLADQGVLDAVSILGLHLPGEEGRDSMRDRVRIVKHDDGTADLYVERKE